MFPSLNNLLLSKFAYNIPFGPDINSFFKRNQILFLIYINLGLASIVIGYEFLALFFLELSKINFHIPTIVCFCLLSFFFLREGKSTFAAFNTLICVHILTFLTGSYYKTPLLALYGLMASTNFIFLMCPSCWMRILQAILCGLQSVYHVLELRKIFQVGLTNEQSQQISGFIWGSIICLIFLSFGYPIHKSIEDRLYQLARSDNEKIQKLLKETTQTTEERDIIMSLISGEIKSHLSLLNGSIDALSKAFNDSRCPLILKSIKLSGEILTNFLNTMIDALKLKAGRLEVFYTPGDFEEIVSKVFMLNSENIKVSQLSAQANLDFNVPKLLKLDSLRLQHILNNVMSNLIKFAKKGSKLSVSALLLPFNLGRSDLRAFINDPNGLGSNGLIDLQRSIQRTESNIFKEFTNDENKNRSKNFQSIRQFEIKPLSGLNEPEPWIINRIHFPDFLSGKQTQRQEGRFLKVQILASVPEEKIEKLFDMFAQASFSTDINKNNGIGFWVSKQLCQTMAGEITVHNQPNQGVAFVFYIPIMNDDIAVSSPDKVGPVRDRINALVVDDYDYNRHLHKLILERQGVQVKLACDGREALEEFKTKEEGYYDLILMDIQMPVMDGFTAAKKICEHEESKGYQKKVDIFFVSGEYFHEEEVRAKFVSRKRGSQTIGIKCLRKPIDLETIKKVIEQYKSNLIPSQLSIKKEESLYTSLANKESDIRNRKSNI